MPRMFILVFYAWLGITKGVFSRYLRVIVLGNIFTNMGLDRILDIGYIGRVLEHILLQYRIWKVENVKFGKADPYLWRNARNDTACCAAFRLTRRNNRHKYNRILNSTAAIRLLCCVTHLTLLHSCEGPAPMGTPAYPLEDHRRLCPSALGVSRVFPMHFQGLAARVSANDA